MTAKERQRMQRLEVENRVLREKLAQAMEINNRSIYEAVDMKIKLELIEIALRGNENGE